MKKPFKLPRDFTEKWLEALRSDKYTQGAGFLFAPKDEEDERPVETYCCLGVGAVAVCNIPKEEIKLVELPFSGFISKNYPSELISTEENFDKQMEMILTLLNDGIDGNANRSIFNDNVYAVNQRENRASLIFHKDKQKQYTFKDIAQFIEDNTELY